MITPVLIFLSFLTFLIIYIYDIEMTFKRNENISKKQIQIPKIEYRPLSKVLDPMFIYSNNRLRF